MDKNISEAVDKIGNALLSVDRDLHGQIAEQICNMDATIQQDIMRLFLHCIAKWSNMKKTGNGMDRRNQVTCEVAESVHDLLDFGPWQKCHTPAFVGQQPIIPYVKCA